MKDKHNTPGANKRKLNISQGDESSDKSTPKQVKLDNKEQTKQGSSHSEYKRKLLVKPNPIKQTTTKEEMSFGLANLLNMTTSPSKSDNTHDGESVSEVINPEPESDSAKINTIMCGIKTLIDLNTRAEKRVDGLEAKVETGLTRVDNNVTDVTARLAALEKYVHGQTLKPESSQLSAEERHEIHCQEQIEESKRCVTLLGSGTPRLTVEGLQQLLIDHKVMQRGELEVVGVQRLGNPKGAGNPVYKVELKSAGMATSLIENSKAMDTEGPSMIRCVRYFPEEYAERAREMKAMQGSAWRCGLYSQIYFEGTKMCLKVKPKGSNKWMAHPSEFATYKPDPTLSATASATDSTADRETRDLIAEKLNYQKVSGKLWPKDVILKSLVFTSQTCHLTESNVSERLPPEVVAAIVDIQPMAVDSRDNRASTRLTFKSRSDARAACDKCMLESRTAYPINKGEFIELESIWDR